MELKQFNAHDYEQRYQKGYGHLYPESHIIRVHRQILEWELHLQPGKIFDFGCGSGANLSYFTHFGYEPYGCDTSTTAIERCKLVMPEQLSNFHVSPVYPVLTEYVEKNSLTIFLSNQVFYFLQDNAIKSIVQQAYELVKPGGVFIASMMSYSCWYSRYITGESGDFKIIKFDTPRQNGTLYINIKNKEEIEPLFHPFKKLHLGSYASHIREEEGSTDHWLFVGIRE